MAKSTWEIYLWNEDEDKWKLDGTINRPNADTGLEHLSTQAKISLIDGSDGYFTPEICYKKMPITFVWYYEDSSYYTKILNYVKNHSYLKIVDHNLKEYKGRFISIESKWLVGTLDKYDITAVFEVMED